MKLTRAQLRSLIQETINPDTQTVMVFDPGSTGMDVGQGWRDAGYTSTPAGRSRGR